MLKENSEQIKTVEQSLVFHNAFVQSVRISVTMNFVRYYFGFLLWILKMQTCRGGMVQCNNAEECLIRRLFENSSYDSRARPLPSYNEDVAVQVTLRLDLYRLIDVDVKQGRIALHGFVYETWTEPRLVWNPIEFANITTIFVDHSHLWIPDTILINAATNSDNRPPRSLARVQALFDPRTNRWTNSQIFLSYSAILEPFCVMDTRYFPFDRQVCYLTLGSSAYDGSKLEFHSATDRMTLERFENVGEWTIGDLRIAEDYVFYNCCRLPFSQLTARIVITRKPLFYVANLILPTLVTNLLATVGLFSNLKIFGGELTAVTLGLTTLLAFSILLLSVSEQMPRGSQWISLMGCFFFGIIVQTSVATVTSVSLMRSDRRNRFKRAFCRRVREIFPDEKIMTLATTGNIKEKKAAKNVYPSFGSCTEESDNDQCPSIDRSVENWCMCFHIVFTLTFTVIVLLVGAVNAYMI